MKIHALQLLNYLKENDGLHSKITIAPLIAELIPTPLDFYNYRLEMSPLYQLLHRLQDHDGFINYDEPPSPNGSTYTWEIVKNIKVELTTKGDEYLKEDSRQDVEFELNKRLLESHELSQKVNQSVIDTNNQMVGISKDQAKTNKTIADNSTTQTDIFKTQKWILWGSVFVAACSAFISYLTYRKDVPNNRLQQELKVINKRIDTLMQRLPQTKNTPPTQKATKPANAKK